MGRTLSQSNIGALPPDVPDLPTGGGGNEDRDRPQRGNSRKTSLTGIVVLMCASIMTFASFVSAMLVRRGLGSDWGKTPLPQILWTNTGVLILSSIAFEAARRMLNHQKRDAFTWLWSAGCVLGLGFVAGQIVAWRQLQHLGFYVASNPSSSFFFVMTWAHAAHVAGALLAVLYVEFRTVRFELGPSRRTMMVASAIFWHFLDVVWLALMGLFILWA